MALMTWSSKYSVGVEVLDNHHKALMNVLNELHAASMKGKVKEVAGPLMRQIVSVSNEHFVAEEKIMESTGYPGLPAHRAKHRELSGKIAELVARHQKGDTAVYVELLYFIRDWQSNHMQTEDQDYAPWFRVHGVH